MSSIDQQFVEFVVKSLVSNPEAVQIERRIDEKGVLLELTVDPEDLGRVIGKRGATAQSIRTLLRALGTKNEARYNLKIIDNGVAGHTATDDSVHTDYSDDHVTQSNSHDDNTTLVMTQQDDDVDADYAAKPANKTVESDVVAKTRKELEAYDDLDV